MEEVQTYCGNKCKVPAKMRSASSKSKMEASGSGKRRREKPLPTPTLNYRAVTIGKLLMETLEELFEKKKISESICRKTWSQFDRSVLHVFQKIPRIHLSFKAQKMNSYFKNEDWVFALENVEIKERYAIENVAKLKMVVFNGWEPTPKAVERRVVKKSKNGDGKSNN